jgi:hypothetical protein
MSYITKKGQDAMESATEQNVDYSEILKPFTSGKSYNVRVPNPVAFVEYFAHSVYKVFYTTPCTSVTGEKDLYCKAADLLYKDAERAEKAGNDKHAEDIRENQAYPLKKKKRYLVGFFSLETGEPIILDLTKNQAETIIEVMKKRKNKLDSYAFNISKTGTGQGTKTSLDLILDPEEELTKDENKHFEATKEKEFDEELFEKVLKVADEEQQIKDLEAFGFDVTRLGVTSGKDASENEGGENENADGDNVGDENGGDENEDLGF